MKSFNVRVMNPWGEMVVKQIKALDLETARLHAGVLYGWDRIYAVSLAR